MYFNQFISSAEHKVSGVQIESQTHCYDKLIQQTSEGVILVDRQETLFNSIDEAVEYVKHSRLSEDIQKEIQQDVYEDLPDNKIASIIESHHGDVRITDTLIESYVEFASSKLFTTDPVVQDIRSLNKLDQLVENHIDCVLEDGSVIVISESTQQHINKVFGEHPDIIKYMRESSDNFLDVLNQLEE